MRSSSPSASAAAAATSALQPRALGAAGTLGGKGPEHRRSSGSAGALPEHQLAAVPHPGSKAHRRAAGTGSPTRRLHHRPPARLRTTATPLSPNVARLRRASR